MKKRVPERPTSITVIAWFLIIVGILSLITTTITFISQNQMVLDIMSESPIPIPLQYLISYMGLFVSIIGGFGILYGENWARFLYFIWGAISIVLTIFTSSNILLSIPGLVLFVIITFFLFISKAGDYFDVIEDIDETEAT